MPRLLLPLVVSLALGIMLVLPGPVEVSAALTGAYVYGLDAHGGFTPGDGIDFIDGAVDGPISASGSGEKSYSYTGYGTTLTLEATAKAQESRLSGLAQYEIDYTGPQTGMGEPGGIYAYFKDTWTYDTPTGDPGWVILSGLVNGYVSLYGEPSNGSNIEYNVTYYKNNISFYDWTYRNNGIVPTTDEPINTSYAERRLFDDGDIIRVEASLYLYLGSSEHTTDMTNFLQFLNSGYALVGYAPGYSPAEGYLLTSAAGATPGVVPLPGAVWLLGTGLLGLGAVGWRRRRKE